MNMAEISQNDRSELEKFSAFLAATAKWEQENEAPTPASHLGGFLREKAKFEAHCAIYRRIYGEDQAKRDGYVLPTP